MALFDPSPFETPARRETAAHLRITTEGNAHDIIDSLWLTRSTDLGLRAREYANWGTRALDCEDFLDRLEDTTEVTDSALERGQDKVEVLVRVGGALLMLGFEAVGHLWVGSAAATRTEAAGALEFIEGLFPEEEPDDGKPSVAFSVWTDGMSYPNHYTTEVTPWNDLASNYPKATRDRLAALADPSFKAGRDGRLLLLYGPPGTGKSTFIASLAWAWKGWADLQIVTDPSAVLGDMRYLSRVALSRGPDSRWGLVVLEDSGSLFLPDAEQRSGESRLGALLNVGDGILGKTSRTLWACTTNLPLERLNAAVSRPGRCAAHVHFTAFPPDEAKEWFESKERPDLAAEVHGELTLAELYGRLNGVDVDPSVRRQVGFRRAQ